MIRVTKFPAAGTTSKKIQQYWYMVVSKNNGTPKSSILIGFSIINHPFLGTPIFGNHHILVDTCFFYGFFLGLLQVFNLPQSDREKSLFFSNQNHTTTTSYMVMFSQCVRVWKYGGGGAPRKKTIEMIHFGRKLLNFTGAPIYRPWSIFTLRMS